MSESAQASPNLPLYDLRQRLKVVIALLVWINAIAAYASPKYDLVYVSTGVSSKGPISSFTGTSKTSSVRIADTTVSNDSSQPIEVGLALPYGFSLNYMKVTETGRHSMTGSSTTTQCIRIVFRNFCGLVELTDTGTLNWKAERQSLTADYSILGRTNQDDFYWTVGAGVDVIALTANASSSSFNQTETGTVPLPFLSSTIRYSLTQDTSFSAKINYLNHRFGSTELLYQRLRLSLHHQIYRYFTMAFGFASDLLQANYDSPAQSSQFRISTKTPELRFIIHY
jgi:hypothetical protein